MIITTVFKPNIKYERANTKPQKTEKDALYKLTLFISNLLTLFLNNIKNKAAGTIAAVDRSENSNAENFKRTWKRNGEIVAKTNTNANASPLQTSI